MENQRKPLIRCMAMVIGSSLSVPVLAQSDAGQTAKNTIEEVVVTARRKEELLQDVPVAITAMSADDIQRENIGTMQDFQGKVPSLTINSNSQMRNTETPTIRGQGATYSAGPGVILYWGEVAVPADVSTNAQGGPGKFFDIANVQVLKGPQGTLFGRNSTGGALLIEPNKPKNEFSASIKAEATSYSGQGYEGTFNTPLIDDVLLLRIGGQFFDREGFTKDVVTGTDYDNKHFWTSRFGLTWLPNESIENTILSYYTDSDDNGTGTVLENMNTTSTRCLPVNKLLGDASNCGSNVAAEQQARDHRHVQLSADPRVVIRTGAIIDNFSWNITDNLTLKNIISHAIFKHLYRWDQDGSRLGLSDQTTPNSEWSTDERVSSEEIQLQGTAFNNDLSYVVGAYYDFTDADTYGSNTSVIASRAVRATELQKESYAPFVQGTYDFGGLSDSLSGLKLTLGARYTTDKVDGSGRVKVWIPYDQVLTATVISDEFVDASMREEALTYTAGLDYKFDNHLLYGKVSRGYKSGGVQPTAVNKTNILFKPEYVTNYEIGLKSDYLIGEVPARLNMAAYYTDFTDMQKTGADSRIIPNADGLGNSQVVTGASTFNVGRAEISGFEIESTIQPTPALTLAANYSYTDAKYKEYNLPITYLDTLDCSGQYVPKGTAENPNYVDFSCLPMQGVAEQQGTFSARYTLPLDPSIGEVETSMTYSSSSKVYSAQTSHPDAEPGAWLPSYWLLGASVSWRNIFETTFDAQLYATNLTNNEYRISNSNVWDILGYRSSIYSEPRIIGLKVGYNWK